MYNHVLREGTIVLIDVINSTNYVTNCNWSNYGSVILLRIIAVVYSV